MANLDMVHTVIGLEWIFFDLGSTLVDEAGFEKYIFGHVYEALTSLGITVSRNVFDDCIRMVVEERGSGSGGYRSIVRELALHFTKDEKHTQNIIEAYDADVTGRYLEMQELYPETIGVLRELKHGYRLGLIANQPKEAKEHIENLGLTKYLELAVLSSDVGLNKPDPRIFIQALKMAECPPQEAMMVGDRLDNDIAPAKSIGMRTVRVKRGLMAYQEPLTGMESADHEVLTLEGLLAIV